MIALADVKFALQVSNEAALQLPRQLNLNKVSTRLLTHTCSELQICYQIIYYES